MIALEHLPLWQKIQPFTIDDPQAATPFSAKLAKEQSWSPAFTSRAIEEYKKFILLCCISEKGASPSKTVDEVWHLHLTYTRNYWKDFCGDTLERELHHHPSAGGNNEDLRHLEWYRDTLNLYRQTFGEEAPADIWPPPLPPEPEEIPEPSFEWRSNGWMLIALLALPFVFIGISYDTFSPFELGGPHFLVFFPVCAISFLAAYCLYIDRVNAGLVNTVRDYFPVDVTAFQIAGYLYGKHRALQVAIVNMIESNMLTVEPDGQHFRVHNRSYAQRIYEINPLAETWAAQENDSIHSYKDILGNWFDREKFKHPRLEAFDRFVHRKEKTSMARKALIGVLAGILLARFIQAAGNNRPVSFLMVETVLLSIVIAIVASVTRRPRLVNYLIKQHFTKSYDRDASLKLPIADRYAIEGRSAIAFFSEGVILSALFDKYDPRRFRSGLGNWENSSDNSGTGGGGDSGGSSCGGGSCGGGGGCGGCGGGH